METGGLNISTTTAISVVVGLVGAITFLFKLLWNSKEREFNRVVEDLRASKENFEKLAAESLTFATQQANWAMQQRNLPPIVPVAAVVPRSQSPSTPAQRETARMQTMIAQLAQLKLMMGLPPNPAPPREPQTATEQLREADLELKPTPATPIAPRPAAAATPLTSPSLQKAIAAVPEKTAQKVVEKLEEKKKA